MNDRSYPMRAWLFDDDGVLTDPELKRIRYPEIFDELIARFQKGEPVGINTGRSLVFIKKQFLDPLKSRMQSVNISQTLLTNVFITAEKGQICLTHNKNGEPSEQIELKIPDFSTLQSNVKYLVKKQFSDVLFFDKTKQTMITLEMNDGVTLSDFRPRQEEIVPILHALVAAHGLKGKVKIDTTTIGVDIEAIHSGKALGASRFVDWLAERNIVPDKVMAFGDSASDYDMAEELYKTGFSVSFVFTGRQGKSENSYKFPVVYTKKPSDEGTLAFLQENRVLTNY